MLKYPVKVVNVDVNKNSVKTSQDFFANRLKRSRERNVGCHWENVFVVDLKVKTLN
jgi:hypothetical protein